MKRYLLILGGLVLLASVAAFAITWRQAARLRSQAKRLNEFCVATRWAIEEDRAFLMSGDPKKVQQASSRFFSGQQLYHSVASIQYCIASEKLPSMPAQCALSDDVKCRVRIADDLLAQLPKAP